MKHYTATTGARICRLSPSHGHWTGHACRAHSARAALRNTAQSLQAHASCCMLLHAGSQRTRAPNNVGLKSVSNTYGMGAKASQGALTQGLLGGAKGVQSHYMLLHSPSTARPLVCSEGKANCVAFLHACGGGGGTQCAPLQEGPQLRNIRNHISLTHVNNPCCCCCITSATPVPNRTLDTSESQLLKGPHGQAHVNRHSVPGTTCSSKGAPPAQLQPGPRAKSDRSGRQHAAAHSTGQAK